MSPQWSRIADELGAVADDRALAASNEPDPVEARMLRRESVLLGRAAMLVRSGLMPPSVSPTAQAAVVMAGDDIVVWGMSHGGEAALRRLARDPYVDVDQIDPARVLEAVLGPPPGPPED